MGEPHAQLEPPARPGERARPDACRRIVRLAAADPSTTRDRALGSVPRDTRIESGPIREMDGETRRNRERIRRRRREPGVQEDAAALLHAQLGESERSVVGIASIADPVVVEVPLPVGDGRTIVIGVADAVAVRVAAATDRANAGKARIGKRAGDAGAGAACGAVGRRRARAFAGDRIARPGELARTGVVAEDRDDPV